MIIYIKILNQTIGDMIGSQGHVDNGDGDADVINKFSLPEKRKKEEDKTEMYAWKYDPDVISTGHSITQAEDMRGDKLTYAAVGLYRGRNMVFENSLSNHALRASEPPAAPA